MPRLHQRCILDAGAPIPPERGVMTDSNPSRDLSGLPEYVRQLESRLAQTEVMLTRLTENNERLVAALSEAREFIVELKTELDRTTQLLPPDVRAGSEAEADADVAVLETGATPRSEPEGAVIGLFDHHARSVIVLAMREARRLNHHYLGTEHLLLGVIQESGTIAADVLELSGITLAAVRRHVEELMGVGQPNASAQIPFTPRARKVLELSLREARELGQEHVGADHLLLGVVREGDGVAVKVLLGLSVDLKSLRKQVIGLLAGSAPAPAVIAPADPPRGVRPADAHVPVVFADAAMPTGALTSAASYLQRARQRSKDDFAGKIADLTEAVRMDPNLSEAFRQRGYARLMHGDDDGAVADFDEAVRLDPGHAAGIIHRGLLRRVNGDLDGAVADFDEAIRLDPRNADAFNSRGSVRRLKRDAAGAISDFDQAIRLNPEHASALASRGEAKFDLQDLAGAVSDYDQAIRLDPWKEATFLARALARHCLGENQAAVVDCDQAIRLNPDLARAFYLRAAIRWAVGNGGGAVDDMAEACRLAPGDKDFAAVLDRYRSGRG